MEQEKEVSNLMLASNVMLRTRYERDPWQFIPAELLPDYYADARAIQFLSPSQRVQMEKRMFLASKIIEDDSE